MITAIALIFVVLASFGGQGQNASSSSSQPAKRNELLRLELNWIFGSKPQRGWYLYTPLIKRLIDTKHEPASKGFGLALARWQKKSGLMPSGVLDDETLYKMIAEWQSDRIKDRTPAQPGQLLRPPSPTTTIPHVPKNCARWNEPLTPPTNVWLLRRLPIVHSDLLVTRGDRRASLRQLKSI